MSKEKSVAKLSILNAKSMSPARRKEVSNWLRRLGRHLLKDGSQFAAHFTAEFIPTKKKA